MSLEHERLEIWANDEGDDEDEDHDVYLLRVSVSRLHTKTSRFFDQVSISIMFLFTSWLLRWMMMHGNIGNQQPAKDWEMVMFQYCGATCTDTVSHPNKPFIYNPWRPWVYKLLFRRLLESLNELGYLRNEAKKRKKGPKEFDWSKATFHHFVTWMSDWVVSSSFPETNSSPLKIRHPKRKCHLPTIDFQGLC